MKCKGGFTMIELLAVVMIIAILTSIAVPQYRRSVQRAEATEAIRNLQTMFESAMRYRAENSEAPENVQSLDVAFYDAVKTGTRSSSIGLFNYSFSNSGIKASRLKGNGAVPNDDTYYFYISYFSKWDNDEELGIGTMMCVYRNKKYANVCPGFGTQIGTDAREFVVRPL